MSMLTLTGTPDLDDYLVELTMARLSPQTILLRRTQLRAYRNWLATAGRPDPRDVKRGDVVRYLSRYANAETASSNRAALRGFYRWLTLEERIQRDPCVSIPPIRKAEPQHNVIPDTLVLQALAGASDETKAAIILGRFAGLRASEIALAHRSYLRRGLDGPVVRVLGKGDKWRELPAHPEVERVLRDHRGYLFPGRTEGLPMQGRSMSKRLGRELPGDWTAHSLRHAFATEAYARTRDLRLVQEWLGHAKIQTTVRYVQVEQNHDAMRLLRLDLRGDDDGPTLAAAS